MGINEPLFTGEAILLGPIDHEKDAEIESRWRHDPEYLRMISSEIAWPQSADQIKKRYEAIEKVIGEKRNLFYFTIRTRADGRLIGFAEIFWIEWAHGNGFVRLGIGSAPDRRKGYGSEALGMLLRFAFEEANLFRLSARIPDYNLPGFRLFLKFGFVEEVRRRQALNRNGQSWDMVHLGLLVDEWARKQASWKTGSRVDF